MIIAIGDNNDFETTLKSILNVDEEFVITKHILKAGETIRLHHHPEAREWIRISNGKFEVTVDKETNEFELHNEPTLFHFHSGIIHALKAITGIQYIVIRNKKDDIIYADGQWSETKPKWAFNYWKGNENPRIGDFSTESDAEIAKRAMEAAGIKVSTNVYKKDGNQNPGKTELPRSEFCERAELIETILDCIKPIPKNAPDEVQEEVDAERQMLVMRAGWNKMPIEELRQLVKK